MINLHALRMAVTEYKWENYYRLKIENNILSILQAWHMPEAVRKED